MIVVFGRGHLATGDTRAGPVAHDDPTFHVFASEWLEAKRHEGLGERTLLDYEWSLAYHLLPFFSRHRLSAITVREVDRYKATMARERSALERGGRPVRSACRLVCPRTQQTRPSSGSRRFGVAVEYGMLPGNPARGRRRRLDEHPAAPCVRAAGAADGAAGVLGVVPPWPRAAAARNACRDGPADPGGPRPPTRHVNLARGTLTVEKSKTDAGVCVVDLTPALRDERALWLDRSLFKEPTDLVFPTLNDEKDCRQNVRRRLLHRAIEKARSHPIRPDPVLAERST